MATRIRLLVTGAGARRAARHMAGTQFCDSCSQVCDAACRSTAHRRRMELAVAQYGPAR